MSNDSTFIEPRRARRIRDRSRMRARALRIYARMFPKPWGLPGEGPSWRDDLGRIHTGYGTWEAVFAKRRFHACATADNMTVCSGWGMGNPRRFGPAPTLQELRAAEDARDQMIESGLPPQQRPRSRKW